jgi:hypothetical protein
MKNIPISSKIKYVTNYELWQLFAGLLTKGYGDDSTIFIKTKLQKGKDGPDLQCRVCPNLAGGTVSTWGFSNMVRILIGCYKDDTHIL